MTDIASIGKSAVENLRDGGISGLRASGRRWLRRYLGPGDGDLGIRTADLSSGPAPWRLRRRDGVGPLTITWVITPPGPGSGGHTTLFRMVRALEKAGHRCRLAVYDHHGRRAGRYEETIRRWWPDIDAPVGEIDQWKHGTDAFVATAWQTAHVLSNVGADGARLYFAQDYEPWFYAQGSVSDFADQTYRFGFEVLTVGKAVADELARRHGLNSVIVPYGCDHDTYSVMAAGSRDSVIFYSRPGVARRGFEVGLPALERFHEILPDVDIHILGTVPDKLRFPAVLHPTNTPRELNALYQNCAAGLALSYTNVSLLPFELLAAGVVPVMNDWAPARRDLDAPHAVWGVPTPEGMADALVAGYESHRMNGAHAVAADVSHVDWGEAGAVFVEAVERACHAVPAIGRGSNG